MDDDCGEEALEPDALPALDDDTWLDVACWEDCPAEVEEAWPGVPEAPEPDAAEDPDCAWLVAD